MWRLFRDSDEPYVPPKNPFQVFLLTLGLLQSGPLLQGDAGSALLEAALPDRTVILWGWCLLIGCGVTLVGIWLPIRVAVFALVLERSGLILVAGAAAIYAYFVWNSADLDEVRYAVAIQIGFSLACVWRCFQITKGLRWALSHPKNMTRGGGQDG